MHNKLDQNVFRAVLLQKVLCSGGVLGHVPLLVTALTNPGNRNLSRYIPNVAFGGGVVSSGVWTGGVNADNRFLAMRVGFHETFHEIGLPETIPRALKSDAGC